MNGAEFELDHLFVCTDIGAPEAAALIEFGLAEGSPNEHPGQGTACRRFFFGNAYLELLWVADPPEAQSDAVQPTLLWPRWSNRKQGACPFGVCLRPRQTIPGRPPFSGWEYRPPYLAAPLVIHVANDLSLAEPMWFYLEFGRRPDASDSPRRQPTEHGVGFKAITHVRIMGPEPNQLSEAARATLQMGVVEPVWSVGQLLEITFDSGLKNCEQDFRPMLPVVFRW